MLKVKIDYLKIVTKSSTLTLSENLSFNLQPNSVNTIIGKNGTGKTSLLLALTRLLDKNDYDYGGSVIVEETDLFKLSENDLREFRSKNIRYVLQDPIGTFDPLRKLSYYFDLLKLDSDELNQELNYFQLPKYNELKGLHSYELSVGMAQRINIIMALLSKPKLLLLDEPTSALDLPIANLLYQRLREFVQMEDGLALVVTQDFEFAKKVSDHIALLSTKDISKFYPTNEFLRNKENPEILNFISNYHELAN